LSFTLPQEKIIWDVGHQSYTHKLLTGRRDGFATLRQMGGMSGFPRGEESDCDCFDAGHSSTSISAGLGMVRARELLGEKYSVVSVIGDGAMTGGMAFEAMDNLADLKSNFIIVLNDNDMSISKNVGGMNRYLSGLRTADAYRDLKDGVVNSLSRIPVVGERTVKRIRNAKNSLKQMFIPGMFFEQMGILYLGPVDGSNIKEMRRLFGEAKRVKGPVLVHVLTKKGSGYLPAERHPAHFHGVEPFDVTTGRPLKKKEHMTYSDVFSAEIRKIAAKNEKVVAVTAAMADGTGLKKFSQEYPKRFFDVGIAEAHAVTFSAGMAKMGLIPVFAAYSSFLQRSYDQILHDVCIQKLPVVLAVDRAGLIGKDGVTHQGAFDISYLSSIPGMTVMAPKNRWELEKMLDFAVALGAPAAIRYPRGEAYRGLKAFDAPIEMGKSETIYEEGEVALFALGSMVETAEEVRAILKEEGHEVSLINARFAAPIDFDRIRELGGAHKLIVTMEENVASGGMGEHVAAFAENERLRAHVMTVAIPDQFVGHGDVCDLKKSLGLDAESVAEKIRTVLEHGKSKKDKPKQGGKKSSKNDKPQSGAGDGT
ncbi:MAG: 1-deoxy-D-xylulose-5-phosphate synthase, partial [Clostridiales bacterium]|nr:1-deoxy-D-xylulose-5-phosphate synthase [Clostridiales bacterium]